MTARHRYEMEDSQRGASRRVGKRERNNCFIKKKKRPQNIESSPRLYFLKQSIFSLFLIVSRRVQLSYLESIV